MGAKVKTSRRQLIVWFSLLIASGLFTVLALFNFWAAVDLGYDKTPQGKTILTAWARALLVSLVLDLTFVVLALRSRA